MEHPAQPRLFFHANTVLSSFWVLCVSTAYDLIASSLGIVYSKHARLLFTISYLWAKLAHISLNITSSNPTSTPRAHTLPEQHFLYSFVGVASLGHSLNALRTGLLFSLDPLTHCPAYSRWILLIIEGKYKIHKKYTNYTITFRQGGTM